MRFTFITRSQRRFIATICCCAAQAEMKRKLIVVTLPVMFANLEKLVNNHGLYINKQVSICHISATRAMQNRMLKSGCGIDLNAREVLSRVRKVIGGLVRWFRRCLRGGGGRGADSRVPNSGINLRH